MFDLASFAKLARIKYSSDLNLDHLLIPVVNAERVSEPVTIFEFESWGRLVAVSPGYHEGSGLRARPLVHISIWTVDPLRSVYSRSVFPAEMVPYSTHYGMTLSVDTLKLMLDTLERAGPQPRVGKKDVRRKLLKELDNVEREGEKIIYRQLDELSDD